MLPRQTSDGRFIDTYLKNAFLCDFLLPNGTQPTLQFGEETIPLRVVFGTVLQDPSRRYSPGNWCVSSAVMRFRDEENVASTLQSYYMADCQFKKITLPIAARQLLQQGIAPSLILDEIESGQPDSLVNKLLAHFLVC